MHYIWKFWPKESKDIYYTFWLYYKGKFKYSKTLTVLKDPLHPMTSTFYDNTSQHGDCNEL